MKLYLLSPNITGSAGKPASASLVSWAAPILTLILAASFLTRTFVLAMTTSKCSSSI